MLSLLQSNLPEKINKLLNNIISPYKSKSNSDGALYTIVLQSTTFLCDDHLNWTNLSFNNDIDPSAYVLTII